MGQKMLEQSIRDGILQLKKEKDVAILAHYYVDGEVQGIADYVGGSYYLAEKATGITQENLYQGTESCYPSRYHFNIHHEVFFRCFYPN